MCLKCGRPRPHASALSCPFCRRKPPLWDRALHPLIFDPDVRHLLHLFKYGGRTGLRHLFVREILLALQTYRIHFPPDTLVIPVPLHPARQRERGYNQAALIAEGLARELDLPYSARCVRRSRHTPHQARLRGKERWTNIQAAFTINATCELKNRNILMVDDLVTTGATGSAVAAALKQKGAGRIFFTCAAAALTF